MRVTHTPESAARPETQYFTGGDVRVQPIVSGNDGLEIAVVRFSPGARTYLHTHHVPQVLHCTEGRGILATGTEQNLVEPGDVVYVPAGEEHWHGAAQDSPFVHLSIRPPGETTWTTVNRLRAEAPARAGQLALVALLALMAASACGGDDDEADAPQNPPGNLLLNPGFEEGPEPWITLSAESGFEVTQELPFAGTSSAVLRMADPPEAEGSKVYYLVQELTPVAFPDLVRGVFNVGSWLKGTPKQYVQVVVIAFGADNNPVPAENYQLRYILGGVNVAPLEIGNAQYIFLTTGDPILGDWVAFEANVREDFQNLWNAVPENFDKIRVLFEVRYDDKVAGDGAVEADVFRDELYVGSSDP